MGGGGEKLSLIHLNLFISCCVYNAGVSQDIKILGMSHMRTGFGTGDIALYLSPINFHVVC